MNEIENAIKAIENIYEDYFVAEDDKVDLRQYDEDIQGIHSLLEKALQEKAEREERMQWLEDMDNPLEPIKVKAALDSELLKYNYRKEHKPKDISVLDITIIYALNKVLEDGLKGGEKK